jgi:hypothetical protein
VTVLAASGPNSNQRQPIPWRVLVREAVAAGNAGVISAHTYVSRPRLRSFASPVVLACDDGFEYYVKSPVNREVARTLIADHVLGLLGRLMGAPVPEVRLVAVPQALITYEREMHHMVPGVAHGSRVIPGCGEREKVMHQHVAENRRRLLHLAMLYGWGEAADRQCIYENAPPHLIHSVDHGHFLPDGPDWDATSLRLPGLVTPDAVILGACSRPSIEELRALSVGLLRMTPNDLVGAAAAPPSEWFVTLKERVALVRFLARRRYHLLRMLNMLPPALAS